MTSITSVKNYAGNTKSKLQSYKIWFENFNKYGRNSYGKF